MRMATKMMAIRRPDRCVACGAELPAGTRVEWDDMARHVTCIDCVDAGHAAADGGDEQVEQVDVDGLTEEPSSETAGPADIDVGVAGGSARVEHERRVAKREKWIEERWGTGFVGKTVKVFSEDPQSTRAWKQGAVGEEKLAKLLESHLDERAVVLHDRKVPGTRGNIDHIAIGPSGVWIIDAKKYKGKVERRGNGGMFRSDFRLYVGGRDRSKLVDSMGWQFDAVRAVLPDTNIPVSLALTFVDAEWPILFRKPQRFGNVLVVWPRKLAELILVEDVLGQADVERVARQLAEALPAK